MIEMVVLDIAGTTLQEDGAVYVALREAVEAAGGAPSTADIEHWMGADKRTAITRMLSPVFAAEPPSEAVDAAFADFHTRLTAAYTARPPRVFPGVEDALAKLRAAGIKVALTTGFDRRVVGMVLAAVGWDESLLDAVICTDDVPLGRPAPYMIFQAMAATRVQDVACVLTAGDTVRDLQAGTNAGAGMVVGVLTGGMTAEGLGGVRHTHLLPSVAGIPGLLGVA
jgi:phosphonatase-like hydrolase